MGIASLRELKLSFIWSRRFLSSALWWARLSVDCSPDPCRPPLFNEIKYSILQNLSRKNFLCEIWQINFWYAYFYWHEEDRHYTTWYLPSKYIHFVLCSLMNIRTISYNWYTKFFECKAYLEFPSSSSDSMSISLSSSLILKVKKLICFA